MISLLACFLLKGALKLSLLCSLIAPLSKVFTTKLVTKLLVKLKLTLFPDQFFPVLACLFIHLSSHLLPYDIKKRSRTFKIKAILACGTKKLKNQEPISSRLAKSGHQRGASLKHFPASNFKDANFSCWTRDVRLTDRDLKNEAHKIGGHVGKVARSVEIVKVGMIISLLAFIRKGCANLRGLRMSNCPPSGEHLHYYHLVKSITI